MGNANAANGFDADGKESFQRLTVSSVWIEFHVALRERVELTQTRANNPERMNLPIDSND